MGRWKDRLKRIFPLKSTKNERRPAGQVVNRAEVKSVLENEPPLLTGRDSRKHPHGFRFPEPWVGAGRSLQPPNSSGGRLLSIRVGVDFGTAYTKAAVRIADSVLIVDFGGITATSEHPRLLPGELTLERSGQTWVGRHPEGTRLLSDLKLPFIVSSETSMESKASATAFLAWVLRYIRAWIYRYHPSLLENRTLAWELNLGMPSASWADGKMAERYRKVACAAWVLSQEADTPGLSRARAILLEDSFPFEKIGLDDLQLIPEFVGQLAGYVMSPQRPVKGNELHLLVDVGAGTLDIACFGAYKPPYQAHYNFPTWASAVEPLGTHFLMESRLLGIEVAAEEWSDMSRIPDYEEFASAYGVSPDMVRQVDEEYTHKLETVIGRVLLQSKTKRNPTAREWDSGIRIFMAGGGSNCQVYTAAVRNALGKVKSPMKEMSFHLHEVESQGDIDKELVHRLSVAYGLTFDAESIGDAIPPQDIEDFEPVQETSARPDRDELYPK